MDVDAQDVIRNLLEQIAQQANTIAVQGALIDKYQSSLNEAVTDVE